MLDLAEQIVRAVDEAVAPVTADEARARAGSRTHFRRTAVVATVVSVLLGSVAIVGVLAVLGVGRHTTAVRVHAPSATTITSTSAPVFRGPQPPPLGDVIAKLDISRIDVHWDILQGTTLADEAKGPIHDPATPLPGQYGNVVIEGHRTTHGAPFYKLDELRPGDLIDITTTAGQFEYMVDGSFEVPGAGRAPFPANVMDRVSSRTNSLTLITDTPVYSAAQRLVVTAFRA